MRGDHRAVAYPSGCCAAADPVFDGLHDWFGDLPFAAERLPERQCLGGSIGAFAHVLHLSWLAFWLPAGDLVLEALTGPIAPSPPSIGAASSVIEAQDLAAVSRGGGDVVDALAVLWDHLEALSNR